MMASSVTEFFEGFKKRGNGEFGVNVKVFDNAVQITLYYDSVYGRKRTNYQLGTSAIETRVQEALEILIETEKT